MGFAKLLGFQSFIWSLHKSCPCDGGKGAAGSVFNGLMQMSGGKGSTVF